MKGTVHLACAFLLVVAAVAVPAPARADKGSPPPKITKKLPPEPAGWKLNGDQKAGVKIYKTYCTKCHGTSGTGTGLAGKSLNPRPRDFTDPGMNARTDWQLYLAVKDGGASFGFSEKMTAWKDTLKDQEIRNVVAYIRHFAKPAAK